jgi:hypothetical protein
MDKLEQFLSLVHKATFHYESSIKIYDIYFQLKEGMPINYVNTYKLDYALDILIKRIKSTD